MFRKASYLYRSINRNGSFQLISNLKANQEIIVNKNTFVRYCTTTGVSAKFTRGIAQTARQEEHRIPSTDEESTSTELLNNKRENSSVWLDDKGLVCVEWQRGEQIDKYPSVWLRDNCQCNECFDTSSRQRKLLLRHLDAEIKPANTSFNHETNEVIINWPDGHQGRFSKEWLKARNFTGKALENRMIMADRPKPLLWGSPSKGYKRGMRRYKYKEILENDNSLYLWLKDLQDFGLTLVDGMPENRESIRDLMKRVGCVRSTHYGDIFHVITKPNPNNLAYLPVTLGLHVDLPYYGYNPGTQFLHCIAQNGVIGGENEFADGFYVERLMKENYPNEWRILHTTKVEWNDIGQDMFGPFYKVKFNPIFQLDENGNVNRISYSQQVRDSFMTTLPPENVKAFYKALTLMDKLLYENILHYKLNAGECVVFDNLRILHGRRGFTLTENGERTIQGGYIDWDEVRSKINILELMGGKTR